MKLLRWVFPVIVLASMFPALVAAQSTEDKIKQYEQKITELKGQENSLSKQINLLNSQILLSEAKIEVTEGAINKLESEIGELDGEIDRLEELKTKRLELVLHRIPESYKRSRGSAFGAIFLSRNFSDFLTRVKYLARVQAEDSRYYQELQLTQNDFNERKDQREKKKVQQEALRAQLEAEIRQRDQQRKDKEILLAQTRNSEAVYQQLLAQARAEQLAIQGIVSGGGTEAQVGNVNTGDRIASVIQGSSCNSSGSHLHFIVENGSTSVNPFNYLKNASYQNCSGSSCGSSDGDSFNPQGSWDWPIDEPIKFNQGYGQTWAVNHTYAGQIYSFHNGIDINGPSSAVKAVQPGILYRGFYSGGGGCRLQYVKVKHADSNISTYYLHVNY